MTRFERLMKKLMHRKDYRRTFILGALLAFILLVFLLNKAVFFVLLFVIVNSIVGYALLPVKQFLFGIDFTMLAAVLCGMAFGAKVGFLVALLCSLAKLIAQQSFSIYGMIVIPSYLIIGILAGMLANSVDVFTMGLIGMIIHTVLTVGFSVLLLGGNLIKVAAFLVTNLPMNLFLFYYFAPAILNIMT
jgi:hypothetical protein